MQIVLRTVAKSTVPIPGEILKTTVILGLTFDELMVLAAIPLVLVLPSAMLDFIPLWVSLATVAVGAVGVLIVVFKTPQGQSPVEWFPAYLDRRLKPEKYQLKPKDQSKYGAPEVKYLSVVHTADLIENENSLSPEEIRELSESIEYAESLELPERAQEPLNESNGMVADLLQKVKP